MHRVEKSDSGRKKCKFCTQKNAHFAHTKSVNFAHKRQNLGLTSHNLSCQRRHHDYPIKYFHNQHRHHHYQQSHHQHHLQCNHLHRHHHQQHHLFILTFIMITGQSLPNVINLGLCQPSFARIITIIIMIVIIIIIKTIIFMILKIIITKL